ncbi:MAG TPA: heparan-alpha-glucosaminide N-acetyltransferase, partial [Beijerinckiaceae bacterium]|nr:heparan-alpha-glucosaminide N-acetyltransferase [Beijerinckiaceae bacterium]
AVTIATYFAFPEAYIFFGILHCIAAASVLALPFVFAPAWVTLAVAALVLGARSVIASPEFDAPLLAFVGLGTRVPVTNDYVPLFPYAGLVLAGVAAGRAGAAWLASNAERRWRSTGLVGATLVWAGRHSLPIYLLHQLVLLGALTAIVQVTGPNPAAIEAGFTRDCETSCRPLRDAQTCRAACTCTVARMKQADIWAKAASGRLDADETAQMSGFARQCLAEPGARP